MDKQPFAAADGAAAVGPYSPALAVGDAVYISGQIPLNAEGVIVGFTAADQARQALSNLSAVLAAAGLTTANVVKTTIFLHDMDDFASVNDVYATFFDPPFPARSTVQVARLPKDVKIEIEAIAIR